MKQLWAWIVGALMIVTAILLALNYRPRPNNHLRTTGFKGDIAEDERTRRWKQLADVYLAQQLAFYPPDYIASNPTPERLLETVERFEEDLTDKSRVHRPIRAIIRVGEPIEVSPTRDRESRGEGDPLMQKIEDQLKSMLGIKNGNEADSKGTAEPSLTPSQTV